SSTVTVKSMDLDGSGGVDPQDLLSLSAQWGQGASVPANLKGTGTVDNTDLNALLGQL
ncbi:MAG: hypothetical protein H6Q00_2594, partial [Holophagaceae bacterium]|nr:hypothetical protein [Holophagaceae bacterium]